MQRSWGRNKLGGIIEKRWHYRVERPDHAGSWRPQWGKATRSRTETLTGDRMSPEILHAISCIFVCIFLETVPLLLTHSERNPGPQVIQEAQNFTVLNESLEKEAHWCPRWGHWVLPQFSQVPSLWSYWFVSEGFSEKHVAWNASKLKFLAWLVR